MIEENAYYAVPAISNSSLKEINPEQGGSPMLFKKSILDRELINEGPKKSFENGKIIHKYVEDPSSFVVSEFVKPTETVALWVERAFSQFPPMITAENFYDCQTIIQEIALEVRDGVYGKYKDATALGKFWNEGVEYISYLFLEQGESIILTPQQKEMLDEVVSSINNCPGAYELLFKEPDFGSTDEHFNELAVYWKKDVLIGDDLHVSMNLKSLIDRFILKFSEEKILVDLIDFKTTGQKVVFFKSSFKSYRYYRQLAFYKEAILNYIKQKYPDFKGEIEFTYYIVVVETNHLYQCKVLKIEEAWIRKGRIEADILLGEIGYHQSTGQWVRSREEINHGFETLRLEE